MDINTFKERRLTEVVTLPSVKVAGVLDSDGNVVDSISDVEVPVVISAKFYTWKEMPNVIRVGTGFGVTVYRIKVPNIMPIIKDMGYDVKNAMFATSFTGTISVTSDFIMPACDNNNEIKVYPLLMSESAYSYALNTHDPSLFDGTKVENETVTVAATLDGAAEHKTTEMEYSAVFLTVQ